MDIEQFVKEVLTELASAVNSVDKSKIDFRVNGSQGVDFDLAVVTSSSEKTANDKEGGLKVKVVSAGMKKSGTAEASEQVISRVKFNITAHERQDDNGVVDTHEGFQLFFTGNERY